MPTPKDPTFSRCPDKDLPLKPALDPFPVNTPFQTEVDLYRLGRPLHDLPQDAVFEYDDQYPAIVAEKLRVLEALPDHSICYLTDDLANLEVCLWRLAAKAAEDQPAYLACDANGFRSKLLGLSLARDGGIGFDPTKAQLPSLGQRCYEHLQMQEGLRRLCAMLACSIQEDMTLMRQPKEELASTSPASEGSNRDRDGVHRDLAECLIVAVPTNWDPAEKLGQNFSQIHQHVGDKEGLEKSHGALMKAMINKGPFVRYSWSLVKNSALSQNPIVLNKHSAEAQKRVNTNTPMDLLNSFHFRVERQTFLPFSELSRGLFAIHIYQKPLLEKLSTQDRVDRFADAIETMSPASRAYRAMTDWADLLVDALRGYRPEVH